jgi:hypothetical protein
MRAERAHNVPNPMKDSACRKKKTRFLKNKREKKKKGKMQTGNCARHPKDQARRKTNCERGARAVFRQRELPLEGGGCQRWHR